MAENQTASEDSGQQQQQQQQQDQQQSNQQPSQPDSSPEQESSSDSITPNPRSKTMNMRSSLTSIKVPRAMSGTSSAAEGDHQSHGSGKHHHNHHHHAHNNAGHHSHRVIHRTTSESLRLGSEYPGSSSLTNSTSNSSSIHGGGGSSSLATTTPTNNSNSTTSNHSHSMSSSSSHTHSSHPHPHPHTHSHSHQHISNSGGGPMQRKPKTSSFQITSVTVGNKLSSDNGDDSADDLDESHTDDNSRITDLENETPSVSEDTFSKEDVFFANNALSTTAPVIPTSAQYGLVVVDPIGPSVGQTIQNVQVNVADNIINVVSAVGNKNKKPEVKETQHRSERFKVVKIESTEPFRRGRWMCMDYLDHSGNQVLNKEITPEKTISGSTVSGVSVATTGDDTSRGTTQTAIIVTNDTSANVGGGLENHIDAAAKLTADGNLNIYRSESQTSAGTGQNTNQTITHAQTLGGPINLQQQQPPPQQQQQQIPNQFQGQQFEGGHGQTMPLTDFQQQPQLNGNEPSVAGQSQPASFFATQLSAPTGNGGGGGSTPTTFQQQQQQQQPQTQQQSTPVHGVTLPANILMQNGGGSSSSGEATGINFQTISFTPPSVASGGADIVGGATASSGQHPQQTSQVYVSQPGTNVAPQSYPSAANIIGGATYTNAPVTQQTMNDTQQQSDSNAATPSSGGGSGQSQQQPPPQQSAQFQTMHSNPVAGQTMPILNQMTYDTQSQQQQQPSQTATSSPATISDPTAIAATIHQQQIDNNNFATNNSIIINNNSNNNPAASSSSTTAESSTTINSGGGSGTSNNISQPQQAPSSSSSLSVAGSIQGSSGGSAAAPSTTGSTDDHQLHHNPETETESCASSLALALVNRRKRNSSIPQLPILAPIFNFNDPTDPLNNTTDEDITGTQNIFTHLALGDERYKLPTSSYPSDEAISSLGEYSVMRSLPIPISAGTLGKHVNYDVMAYSASPSNSAYPYSPFYNGSPSSPDTVQQPLSISYDPSYGSNRLYVPTLMSQGHNRNYGDNNRLIRVIDGGRRCGIDDNGKTSSATAAALAGAGGVASVLKSASGTSAVAIDNKIEQAMDLVKSHLMIAVREEVEVLKEKISELMDKINQLEVENTILKSNMSQETLHQLQLQAQLQIAGNGTANLIAAAQQQPTQQTQSQQPTAQPSQTPSSQQPNQQPQQQQQQQAAPQANPANTTNGPMS